MPPIATLPMYDWPECRAETDARWAALRDALRAEGLEAPDRLTRGGDLLALWLSADLLLGETCSHPLASVLAGRVRYVATPVSDAPGCGRGTYRSAILRRAPGADVPPPDGDGPAMIPPEAVAGRMAANEPASMSGLVALVRDCAALGLQLPSAEEVLWTGSHRDSVRAVAAGEADFAAIDCVTWEIALKHEPAAKQLRVAGWTASRPGLPLITARATDDAALVRIRRAVHAVMEAVEFDPPFEIIPLPDPRP
ncbi:phosphate/phosphite/phosphonate ABC transporter substrate-binding protein [Oricola thermophila]|uniref:PhnD/SsuA/transferrin family substrate-binding protein n=1 Tax=Oricola thermophila TaxID=2742145 RepID=A0A6N1VF93_9HYPH|nr:PhnD/SsuA/transferrin family substrate-binding protein [Oricola thermophila]QKV19428.1 PhnD/SsuA/transferrin family substrate-binding protein [Oricola thermophila]